ncbi:MAG: flagellar type III secretion system pore protein FliP [Longimicrobiales bacterium]
MTGLAAAVGVIAALLVVLALLALMLYGARALLGARPVAGDGELAVVRRIAVGPKQGVAVVKVGDRALLISVGDGGVRTLAELPAEAAVAETPVTPFADRLRSAMQGARTMRIGRTAAMLLALLAFAPAALTAQAAEPAQAAPVLENAAAVLGSTPQLDMRLGEDADDLRVTGTVGTVITLGLLTLLPAMLLLMTSFTRILIVLHFLRMALGTQTAPPAQLLAALSLLLTALVMAPTITRANDVALAPFVAGEIDQGEMLRAGVVPFREFMLAQTPERDLAHFAELAGDTAQHAEDVRLTTLMSAFATSELRAAFQMGFAIFLPFIVIDLVVSAVLTGMGMFMLPPTMIALPCKLLLFVLVDGWSLTVDALVASFR